MSSPPRLIPLAEPDARTAELLAKIDNAVGWKLNVNATMAHNPKMLETVTRLALFLNSGVTIPARERELVILRVSWRCRSIYGFGEHTIMGTRMGLSQDEIRRLTSSSLDGWSSDERTLLVLADEICQTDTVTDQTWELLEKRYRSPQLVELVILVGFYRLMSGFMNAMRVASEEGVPGWPG